MSERQKRLALVAGGVLAALAATETILRVAPWRQRTDLRALHVARPDRSWLYGLRPGTDAKIPATGSVRYTINADGFRDRLYARPKPPGTFRVVVLGDSIAFGYGVAAEDTFAKQLERRLAAAAPNRPVEVVNLGVSGYNAYNEATLFADVGVTYEPDVVLLQFCVNDLNDPTLHFDASTQLALGAIPDAAFPEPRERRPLPSRWTRLCHSLRTCTLAFERAAAPTGEELRDALTLRDGSGPELAWLGARYAEVAAAAARRGARFAVVTFPHPAHLADVPAPLYQRIAALGREGGWATIDLLPAYKRAAAEGERLMLDVWHPTAAGHRLAAETIFADLACHGWLPVVPGPGCPP